MAGSRVGLVPLCGAGLLLFSPTLSAQESGACLRPIPSASAWGEVLPTTHVETPPTTLYIDGEGRVCRTLRFSGLHPVPNQTIQERTLTPGRAFVLSAVLPGTGQRILGQDRWVAYLAGEVWAWVQYMERRREGRNLQDRYKDLAWLVARRVSSGPRVDGNFEYYESLTKFQASGAYDLDPDEFGVQPELDPETFNGSMWELAREIFFLDDPDTPAEVDSDQYKKALRYYLSRAYGPVFAWNWSDNALQQGEFAHLIERSDENLRRSTTMVGVIIANHLLSAVDALVTGRLLQEQATEPIFSVFLLPTPFHQNALAFNVRIPTR